MSKNPERDEAIARAVLNGQTLEAAGGEYGLKRERVRWIVYNWCRFRNHSLWDALRKQRVALYDSDLARLRAHKHEFLAGDAQTP